MKDNRPFSHEDWLATPKLVRDYIEQLEPMVQSLIDQVKTLTERVEKLENQLNKNSKNSSKPPSSDPPYRKSRKSSPPKSKGKKRKIGGQKGHPGHQQKLLPADREISVMPEPCRCGCSSFNPNDFHTFYTHQVLELPPIKMDVIHHILLKGKCPNCRKTIKAEIPKESRTGYGPRLSATIAELSGTYGNSRETIQDICRNILNFHISTGAIQKVIDRASRAIEPIYDRIGLIARTSPANYIDETAWYQKGVLRWLWTMTNETIAFFKIHENRSKEAFKALIEDWNGILISDGYGVYIKWIGVRQTCLAHLIRNAKNLAERNDESLQRFGKSILELIQQLCHFADKPPSPKKWEDWFSQFIVMLFLFEGADDDAGKLARRLAREMDHLWTFLEEDGIEPTNNRAERSLRFGVLWRKRSLGTQSDNGDRWVERILSLKQTCRIKSVSSFDILHQAMTDFFKEQEPRLDWLS
jgi:transposase